MVIEVHNVFSEKIFNVKWKYISIVTATMQNTRVIVCKLGRLGELRKVVDTNINQLKDESQPQEMDSGPGHQSVAPGRGFVGPSNLDYFSINQNFENVLMVHDAQDLEGKQDTI